MRSNSIRNRRNSNHNWTKRRLLKSGALGGAALLAGCLGEDGNGENDDDSDDSAGTADDDSTGTAEPEGYGHVEGQAFHMAVESNPEDLTFWDFANASVYTETRLSTSSIIMNAVDEPSMWGRWSNEAYQDSPGETFYGVFESWEYDVDSDPQKITVTIKEDATWSDGTPITARDGVAGPVMYRLQQIGDSFLGEPEDLNPGMNWERVEMPDGPDGKTYSFVSDLGYIDVFSENETRRWLGMSDYPAHIEPTSSMVDAALTNLEIANENPDDTSAWMTRQDIVDEYVTGETFEKFREPENVVTSGAWTLSEILGTESVILEPNPHWRHADEINFDELIFDYVADDNRLRAELQSGRLDAGELQLVEGEAGVLPDVYELVPTPTNAGGGIGWDHNHFAFGLPEVRKAIAYALDTEAIAGNVHQEATVPITRPGGDMWFRDSMASDEWVEENLIDYSQDLERATELMQQAGFSRNGNGVWEKDGETITAQFATTEDTTAFESTIASQLNDFGIELNVRSYGEAVFGERLWNGEFDIWRNGLHRSSPGLAGTYVQLHWFWWQTINNVDDFQIWNFFDDEAVEEATEGYNEAGWVEGQWELWEDLTIDLPPLGESEGTPEPFNPSYFSARAFRGPAKQDPEYYQQLIWTLNWYLPALPIYLDQDHNWLNTANWIWPKDHYMWDYYETSYGPERLHASGMVYADPDNPK